MKLKCCLLTIVFSTFLFAQNNVSNFSTFSQDINEKVDSTLQDSTVNNTEKYIENRNLWLEAGVNLSSFQNVSSHERFGYSFGFTVSHYFTKSLGMDISGIVSRQYIFLKHRKSTGTNGQFVYRTYYDHKISLLFIETPIALNYKLWDKSSHSFYACFGIGYSISVKDYSERTNFKSTNEILDIGIPVDEHYIEDSVFDNSGISVNAGIRFNYNKFLIKFLYINKRYDLKRIDNQHTFSLHFGYKLD